MLRKVFCIFAILVILPTFTANATTELSSFSIFATNNVTLDPNTEVLSGQIGGQNAGSEIVIEQDVFLEDGVSIMGDSVEIGEGASVDDVYYNFLDNDGTIRGNIFTPLVIPLDVTLPQFPTPAPNQDDREVQENQTLTLQPGSYGNVVADEKATYNFNWWYVSYGKSFVRFRIRPVVSGVNRADY